MEKLKDKNLILNPEEKTLTKQLLQEQGFFFLFSKNTLQVSWSKTVSELLLADIAAKTFRTALQIAFNGDL